MLLNPSSMYRIKNVMKGFHTCLSTIALATLIAKNVTIKIVQTAQSFFFN